MSQPEPLVYRPWVARAGMAGMYAHLVKHWGSPDSASHQWPQAVLERVCERGEPQDITCDSYMRYIPSQSHG